LLTTIPVPGGLAGFDISWVDSSRDRYYLTDRTATKGTGRIDVVDTQAMKLLYTIPTSKYEVGFSGTVPATTPGCSISGPNGVLAIPLMNQLYVGDGDSTVKVVDLAARAVVAIIPTGGKCRADEEAYDAKDHIIMMTNPSDQPPYVTFISADTQTVLGRFTYPSTQTGFGLEQPAWNPKNNKFYISVPANKTNTGSVDQFDPITMLMEKSYPTICSPAGLVITPSQRAMTSCGEAFDLLAGKSLGQTMGVGADQLWYNPGDNYFYFGSTQAGVVDASTNAFLTYLPSAGGHTLAVDPNYNRIFAPVSGAGIKVFGYQ
jgi:DNA-binding beta-propeller fold protein YncE